jgi:hypothetical protein
MRQMIDGRTILADRLHPSMEVDYVRVYQDAR